MKEHLRKYFPERFEDSSFFSLYDKAKFLMLGINIHKRKLDCEKDAIKSFERSQELQLLAGAMEKYGCKFKLSRHVSCELCDNCTAGFDPDTKQIILCYNQSLNREQIKDAMMHEMIHMFDYCRFKFDFDNIEHVACSEIRAANLSFCSIYDRLRFGDSWNFKKSHRNCVRDVAFKSVKAYSPETEDSKLHEIIDKVFIHCYNDLEPFGRRPKTCGSEDMNQSFRERYRYGYI